MLADICQIGCLLLFGAQNHGVQVKLILMHYTTAFVFEASETRSGEC